ncbi:helix-turn-helix domain-containing protein [Arthrobacter mobilis]|uniref:Purine catabolism regulatory protein n=1 Tax=Arthrobacter mobilis TaxID=2724944 RepID=A0A7X6K7Q1_9MICC|nr:helix-turn-helix domain-containing protein [Arthrobacter mobilis]NKX56661.1 hypothetical protein [Arthrobacter mobilis]
MATNSGCTIGDLVESPALQLRPLSQADPSTIISSAQIVAASQHIEGLGEGELILVVGWLPADAEDVKRFMKYAVEAKIAAVAFPESSTQQYLSSLAPALDKAGIPVLEIPQATRFADVIDTISRFHASPDSVRFHRLLTMQQSLVAALGLDEPQGALVKKLARLSGASAGIAAASGDVEFSEGVLPFHMMRREIGDSQHPEVEIRASGWNALAVRLTDAASKPTRWLIVGARREHFVDAFVRAAARVTVSLLDAVERIDVIETKQARAVGSSVLNQLLALQPQDNPEVLAERAASLGIGFNQEVRVLEIERYGSGRGAGNHGSLVDRIHQAFPAHSSALLATATKTGAIVLIEAAPTVRADGVAKLLAEDGGLLIGVGRAVTHVRDVPTAHHDAVLASQHARRQGDSRLGSYDDFNFVTRLMAHVGLDRMTDWSSDILGQVRAKPILLEAVQAYFDAQLDVMAAANALHIHHNSLRYRLQKIEEIVGGSLRSPEVIASVQMALMAERAGQRTRAIRPGERPRASGARDTAAIDNPLDGSFQEERLTVLGATIPD